MNQFEKDLRIELAACYRIFAFMGWDELIYNHITVKLPGDDMHFLINPYGLHYREVTASNLVKVDIDGNTIDESDYPVNPAGMLIHSAIHSVRHDVQCIGHVHTDAGMAVACQQEGLRIDNFYSVLLYKQVAYHNFHGITVLDDEKAELIDNLGDKNFLILRSHGLLTCGKSISEMFLNMTLLQRSCEIQMLCDSTGKALVPVSEKIGENAKKLLKLQMQHAPSGAAGQMEFNAMRRLIDREDSSYNDL